MAKQVCIASIQILVDESDEIAAVDGISDMLRGNDWVIDWGYVKIGGQFLYPSQRIISDDYEEGEAFV